jgi:hypothetical protein
VFPRSEAVKEFLKTYAHSERQRKRDEYTDRGIGTLQDGYTTEQHIKISNYYLMENSLVGLRSRFDHLYGHACTLRGLDRRDAELADLFSIDLPQMKWHSKAYITLMDHGKTNQAGRKEVGAMIRHKNLDICPVSAMFQYLFARFYTRSHLFLSSLLFQCCLTSQSHYSATPSGLENVSLTSLSQRLGTKQSCWLVIAYYQMELIQKRPQFHTTLKGQPSREPSMQWVLSPVKRHMLNVVPQFVILGKMEVPMTLRCEGRVAGMEMQWRPFI